MRVILEKDFNEIKYYLRHYVNAVIPQMLGSMQGDLRNNAKNLLLSNYEEDTTYVKVK